MPIVRADCQRPEGSKISPAVLEEIAMSYKRRGSLPAMVAALLTGGARVARAVQSILRKSRRATRT